MLRRPHLLWAVALLLAVLAPAAQAARPFQPGAMGFAHRHVCAHAPARVAHCDSEVVVDAGGAPLVTFTPSGYGPSDLQDAYGLTSLSASAGSTQTIAIVDAYDDPNAESDLGTYRSQFGLSACTTANGCFRKVNQSGGTTYPSANTAWAEEISLDLDMASAICAQCKILLVEATSAAFTNLFVAVDEAAALGATQISNSYGGDEFPGETDYESHYHHAGVAVTVSTGDFGYGVEFPASSRYVTAVGGTSLVADGSARGWTESAWSSAGSGCSTEVDKPSWQTDSGCAMRAVADVSAVADPGTGVAVYDTYGGDPGWMVFGGTSASSPIVAAFDALIGPSAATLSYPYDNASAFNDVLSGSNGSCSPSYLCTGVAGYDGPTGLGSPSTRPSARTQAAAPVGGTSATLNGSVNPTATDTAYHFEYGTTTSYGSQTAAVDAGAGTAAVAASAALTGLTSGVTYHFRLVATNASGTTAGADRTFTPSTAPTATTGPAALILDTSAGLSGTVDPNDHATTYHFEYGTTIAYGSQTTGQSAGSGNAPVAVAVALSGLAPSTTYHYRLVAISSGGTGTGADQTFTTGQTPGVTTNDAAAITQNGASLSGSVTPNRLATTYRFEYGTTTAYGSRSPAIDTPAGNGSTAVPVSTTINDLAAGVTYHFRLVATNAAGTTAGADRTFTTSAAPLPPPTTTTTTTVPVTTTPSVACATTLRVARGRRTALVTIRCAPAGVVGAAILRGSHVLARARRARSSAGSMTIRLVIAKRSFGRARSLKLTVKVAIVSTGGARRSFTRRVTIRR